MPNVLIISDEAEELYTLFRSVKVTLKKQVSEQKGNARENTSVSLGKYDIAFLDLNTRGWHQRILELRQRMPVIAFSKPNSSDSSRVSGMALQFKVIKGLSFLGLHR